MGLFHGEWRRLGVPVGEPGGQRRDALQVDKAPCPEIPARYRDFGSDQGEGRSTRSDEEGWHQPGQDGKVAAGGGEAVHGGKNNGEEMKVSSRRLLDCLPTLVVAVKV